MKYTIIGAGIGGLTTALAFEKKGIPYQVFEQAPELNEVGAGIWLAPNALQVLESLDVLDEVIASGNSIDRITIGKPDLSPISDSFQDVFKDKFGYNTIAIHRAKLQKLLFDKIPKEKLFLNKGFQSFKELSSGRIEVNFVGNSKIQTDFLIGADGINSKVRKQLFPESTTRYSGQTCWRGIADIELDKEFLHRGFELWGNQIRFGISRVAKNKVYWFAVVLSDQNRKVDSSLAKKELLKLFKEFHPIVLKLISETEINQILKNDINDLKPLRKWYQNNVCLIGDAAHATTPNMGQGGAQAIEDAYYLSNLFAHKRDENVFELFQQKRQKKVNLVVNQSWTTGKMAHWSYGRGFRNFIIKNVPKKMIEKKMVELYQIEKINS
ncbi:2-polyprenyl-6-methoxyphenol hydroxylase-like FAD-dependent oxidoreductase [Lutibacter sp. Hel_I_33_5]|uniref:FAD-dependent monooxygenase n=1 Tax=Lutibacter sp. Hel_I_33_5 TaxID=1566289 RepID=UPI00119CACA7|nr:FAD-dependent monooxygenase [Lutibacter sp. Hel_I_33_5]TVZ57049.1 2-polyprenyl-6-methoxyphenol hydroxylase-like FAD-dependent oxidoreductase [Lutibacter sp. Hel_I_33_5]